MSRQALSISLEITGLILILVSLIAFVVDTRNVAANALDKADAVAVVKETVEEVKLDVAEVKGDVKVLLERTK